MLRLRMDPAVCGGLLIAVLSGSAAAQSLPALAPSPPTSWPILAPDTLHSSGVGGSVISTTVVGDTLLASGEFTRVAASAGSGIVLDGPGLTLRRPLHHVDGFVKTAIEDGSGGWYIAGEFTHVGGVPRTGVARLLSDGSADPTFDASATFGTATSAPDLATMLVVGGRLFVGGRLSVASTAGQPQVGIVALDATTGALLPWNPLVPLYPTVPPIVSSIAAYGNLILIAGSPFSVLGGTTAAVVTAHVSTGAPGPVLPVVGTVSKILIDGPTAFVAGSFTSILGVPRAHLAAIDLPTLSVTPWNPGPDGSVRTLTTDASRVFIVGSFTNIAGLPRSGLAGIDRTTGAVTPLASVASGPTPSVVAAGITALARHGAKLCIAGNFTLVDGVPRRGFAAIDPNTSALDPVDLSLLDHAATLAPSAASLYVGGRILGVDTQPAPGGIVAVDAATGALRVAPAQLGGSFPWAELEATETTLFLAGPFTSVNGVPRIGLAAVDLATGSVLPWNPAHNGSWTRLHRVGSTLYVWGNFQFFDGTPRNGIAAIDVVTQTLLPFAPAIQGSWEKIAADDSTVYAAGYFARPGSGAWLGVAAFDAASGTLLPFDPSPGTAISVYAMAPTGTHVYIQGQFLAVNGVPRPGIAELDAATGSVTPWVPSVPFASAGEVLRVLGSNLVSSRNGTELWEIDRITGAAVALTPGFGGSHILDVDVAGGFLHVGGRFHQVAHASHLNLASLPITLPTASVASVGPGCSPLGSPPILASTLPALGSLALDTILGPPNVSGDLIISLPPISPLALSASCTVYLDLATLVFVGPFVTDGAGRASRPYLLPSPGAWWGFTFRKQAVLYLPGGGFALTNGLELTLGY